jgi:hypothetical protein
VGSVASFQNPTLCGSREETKSQPIIDNKLLLSTLRQSPKSSERTERSARRSILDHQLVVERPKSDDCRRSDSKGGGPVLFHDGLLADETFVPRSLAYSARSANLLLSLYF